MCEQSSTNETNLTEEQPVPVEETDNDNKILKFEGEAKGKEPENEAPDIEDFRVDGILGEIHFKLTELNGRLQDLDADFKSKIKYDRHKEKIIDDLHREVQEYKNDLIKQLIRPVVMDIINVIDDITKLVDNHKAKPCSELDPLKLIKQMDDISSDLEDILARQGVESFDSKQPEFDPRSQRIIKTDVTADQSKNRTISKKIHKGYEWDGKVLRQELVNVFVYKPGLENPEENKNEEKKP